MVSEGDVGSIGVWHVFAVSVCASALPIVVWGGSSDLVCVAASGLCSLVTVVATFGAALAICADDVVASTPTVFASTVADIAAG